VTGRRAWGVFRELAHSPGRESDDGEILRLTAKQLEGHGFTVLLKEVDELTDRGETSPSLVFAMCERIRPLQQLRRREGAGTLVVNAPAAILNTYRHRMLSRWRRAGVPFPKSRLLSTRARLAAKTWPMWVKRGDVHNTEAGDVVRVESAAECRAALDGLTRRGIRRAVVQAHVSGDLIKFYGVIDGDRPDRPLRWFRWFYHKDQDLAGHVFDPDHLAGLARQAALTLGLEVFGGDALVTGRPVPGQETLLVIDVNAWPSFALFRDEAAGEIAGYLAQRVAGRLGPSRS
jgi:glutathione synthase/RimK-type ligase-like ATP-grasp enzyme